MVKNAAMLFVWILIGIIAIAVMIRECSPQPRPETIVKHDTITLKGADIVIYKDHIEPHYLYQDVHDTLTRERIVEREVIREKLDSAGTHELLGLDTTVALPVMIAGITNSISLRSITSADCIARTIRQRIITRDTSFTFERKTDIVKSHPMFAIGAGFSYGASLDGRLEPTVALQFSYIFFSW